MTSSFEAGYDPAILFFQFSFPFDMGSDLHTDGSRGASAAVEPSLRAVGNEFARTESAEIEARCGFRDFDSLPLPQGGVALNEGEPIITIETARAEDEAFIFSVYASTRSEELALTGWPESMQAQFLRMQFEAQTRSYGMQFPNAQHSVVFSNGIRAGRMIVDRSDAEIRVVDIAMIPEERGKRIGSRLMGQLLDEAKQAGKVVRLHVDRKNPAQAWYARMGFETVSATEFYLEMVCRPGSGGAGE